MIIDFHTHTFPDAIAARTIHKLAALAGISYATEGTYGELIQSMHDSHVTCSVILPVVTNPGQLRSINDFALASNEAPNRSQDCFTISFGGIHPDNENYKEELHWLADHGFQGIKLHPDYQKVFLDDIRYLRIIDCASSLGLIISVHAGIDVGLPETVHCTPAHILNTLRQTAPQKLVLAHMGGWKLWEEVKRDLCGAPVYFDTSYSLGILEDTLFAEIIHQHGADKILFATDSPWAGQAEYIDKLKRLALTPEEQTLILGENGRRLLSL